MITTFLYSLAGGILAILATGRVEQINWKFLRLAGLIVFAITCLITGWSMREARFTSPGLSAVAAMLGVALAVATLALILMAPLAKRRAMAFRLICAIGGLAGVAAGCASGIAQFDQSPSSIATTTLLIVGQSLSAILLGGITVAWLLGHAYLTATTMTIAPLRHFSRMLSWAVIARAAFFLMSVAVASMVRHPPDRLIFSALYDSWIIVSLRVGVGLVAVGVFSYLVADCVRLRATQSATGILYFGSIFAYVGELAGQQLAQECGWPL